MVGIIDDTSLHYPIGTRIKVGDNYGTVKYVGEVSGYTGSWLGIEWDNPQRGKHNGCVDGRHYFHTQHPNAGSFVRPGKIGPVESLEDAARERYLGYSADSSLDASLIREAQQNMQASFFEVVGMDKIARKQSKFEQLSEVSVDNCPINSAGYLKDFKMLTTLNVSTTLIWNWEIVANICKQVPTLMDLNLSCNRIVLPTDAQVKELEPAFRTLQCINLRNCGYNDWADVIQTAKLWPQIQVLALQENPLTELCEVNCKEIFKNLRELDLHRTKIMDFDQVCKLGNISTLKILNLMENGIEEIKLPDCEPHAKLQMFVALERLNLLYNPIWNEADAFNELDKLLRLKRLQITPHLKSDFDEMFSKAVGMINQLEMLNKIEVSSEARRDASYDIWKRYAMEWLQAAEKPELLHDFYKKHRTYADIIKRYGSPAEFVVRPNTKKSNLIKIRVLNQQNGEIWEKRVPRMITVQTLQGLIAKHFQQVTAAVASLPQLSYIDAKYPELVVPMDNSAKTLDFYSVQEGDTVIVK
ncbi:tubulin-specific chaperone E [Anastrepha obliqua]|uniref:tubulin-specific chaperone E n=1 Tax=Anastrepha obliqua TaxID=95512 RepID=UPI0024098DAF|nr:tubulin-specific chaperone E [Anastrepha obliqua]XP_054740593.1 tubulin-specific chaperone E [Anastrepha obliqua]